MKTARSTVFLGFIAITVSAIGLAAPAQGKPLLKVRIVSATGSARHMSKVDSSRWRTALSHYLRSVLVFIVFVGGWELIVDFCDVPVIILPPSSPIALSFWQSLLAGTFVVLIIPSVIGVGLHEIVSRVHRRVVFGVDIAGDRVTGA